MESWALQAIEREAEKRVELRLLGRAIEDNTPLVLGLTVKQINYLRGRWLSENPTKSAKDIPA